MSPDLMANYCHCKLVISSDDPVEIDALVLAAVPPKIHPVSKIVSWFVPEIASQWLGKSDVGSSVGLLEYLSPMPAELKATVTNGFSGEQPAWLTWRIKEWGCGYDVAPEDHRRIGPRDVSFEFQSRYSPPLEALRHGARKRGLQFRIIYCEPGGQFAGEATEAEAKEYEFSFDVHPGDEGVPQEIIEQFDLDDRYREALADNG